MDKIGVFFFQVQQRFSEPKNHLWDLTSGVQFREICEICVRLCSEAAVEHPWDLTSGVLFREICGICVRLCSEAAVEHP